IACGRHFLDHDQSLAIGEGQRSKAHRVQDAERRRARADAEREREHAGDDEDGTPRQRARGKSEIVPKQLETIDHGHTSNAFTAVILSTSTKQYKPQCVSPAARNARRREAVERKIHPSMSPSMSSSRAYASM